MKIKRANQKDVQALSNFVREIDSIYTVYGHTLSKEYFKSIIRAGFIFYAEHEGDMKGILMADVDARIQFSNIIHVVTHPKHTDDEINTALMEKYITECKKMNISDIALQTPETQQKTVEFFKNLGFAQENKFVLMTKSI